MNQGEIDMKFSKDNRDDVEFIEKWYSDIETGFKGLGKTYTRPADYVERALRIMNGSKGRSRLLHQVEGKKGAHHEDN